RELRLADARLALEEQRPVELEGEERRGGERAVAHVIAGEERILDVLNRREVVGSAVGRGGGTWHPPTAHRGDGGLGRRPRRAVLAAGADVRELDHLVELEGF